MRKNFFLALGFVVFLLSCGGATSIDTSGSGVDDPGSSSNGFTVKGKLADILVSNLSAAT